MLLNSRRYASDRLPAGVFFLHKFAKVGLTGYFKRFHYQSLIIN